MSRRSTESNARAGRGHANRVRRLVAEERHDDGWAPGSQSAERRARAAVTYARGRMRENVGLVHPPLDIDMRISWSARMHASMNGIRGPK